MRSGTDGDSTFNNVVQGRDANNLAKEVMTEENQDRVKAVIGYFENRRRYGADEQDNYARLIKDLEQFKEESDDS